VPFPVRHRAWAAILALLAVVAGVGVTIWVATRAHHGTGKLSVTPPTATQGSRHALQQVPLCNSCAFGYNPLGTPKTERPYAPLAVDNDPTTYWSTQIYYARTLNKAGTGLYVDAHPRTTARDLRIITNTTGFTVTIYAATKRPTYSWPNPAWTRVSSPTTITQRQQQITLTSGTTAYRYWLVWITKLGPNSTVQLNEVTLYK
jgi:serine/threonine-protein kinase